MKAWCLDTQYTHIHALFWVCIWKFRHSAFATLTSGQYTASFISKICCFSHRAAYASAHSSRSGGDEARNPSWRCQMGGEQIACAEPPTEEWKKNSTQWKFDLPTMLCACVLVPWYACVHLMQMYGGNVVDAGICITQRPYGPSQFQLIKRLPPTQRHKASQTESETDWERAKQRNQRLPVYLCVLYACILRSPSSESPWKANLVHIIRSIYLVSLSLSMCLWGTYGIHRYWHCATGTFSLRNSTERISNDVDNVRKPSNWAAFFFLLPPNLCKSLFGRARYFWIFFPVKYWNR